MATRIPLKYVHLQTPLFLGGKNFTNKIKADAGVTLTHYLDGTRNEIHVTHGTHSAYFPVSGNVALAIPHDSAQADITEQIMPVKVPTNPVPQGKVKAQVSAPAGIKV